MPRGTGIVALLALCISCATGCHDCGRESGSSDSGPEIDPRLPAIPLPPPTGVAVIPTRADFPFGVTWNIGFPENVPRSDMDAWYARIVACSASLWNASEGQIHVAHIVLTDQVAPGYTANRLAEGTPPPSPGVLDMMVFSGAAWDIGAGGFVVYDSGIGREDRIIALPSDAGDLPIVHEASHMLFRLSWAPGPLLWDEYEDGLQDADCIMETTGALRWCAADNHVGQASQPTSCWQQILQDYPGISFTGTHRAATQPPPPTVEYNDRP